MLSTISPLRGEFILSLPETMLIKYVLISWTPKEQASVEFLKERLKTHFSGKISNDAKEKKSAV
jgi:hypothetical protein